MYSKYAIIASTIDKAGMNIASHLQHKYKFQKTDARFDENPVFAKDDFQLVYINEDQIYADMVDRIDADVFIFASRHKSESGKPTLTAHAIGNWGKAELGGNEATLVPTSSTLIKHYITSLQNEKIARDLEYEVSLECTHHGPLLSKPTVYIELGSSEPQWSDSKPAEVIADVIMSSTSLEGTFKNAIAIGGGHYCPEFTKLLIRTDYALSHICPKYALPDLNEGLLAQAISKTKEEVKEIVVDWKGLGEHKEKVMQLATDIGLPVQRVRKLF